MDGMSSLGNLKSVVEPHGNQCLKAVSPEIVKTYKPSQVEREDLRYFQDESTFDIMQIEIDHYTRSEEEKNGIIKAQGSLIVDLQHSLRELRDKNRDMNNNMIELRSADWQLLHVTGKKRKFTHTML
jgi:hypothetical protein